MAAASDARGDVRDVGSNYQQLNTTAATAATAAVEADIRLTKVNTSTASTQSTTRHEGLVSVKASPRRDVVPTHSADVLSMNLTTAGSPGNASDLSSTTVGIAVGLAVCGVVLVVVCLAVALLLIRRRRSRRRNKKIVRVENPQYKTKGTDNEEDVTLGVGLTGVTKYSSGRQNGSRKRKEAPLPPIYRPSDDTTGNKSWDSLTKRKAPAPPRNLNVDLYEKDSPRSSVEDLKSVDNKAAKVASPVDDSKDLQTDATHRQPLIASSPSDAGEPDKTPRKNKESTSPVAGPRQSAAAADVDLVDDDVPTTSDVTASLIGKASSHASLDSYDRTKNPFFAN